MQHSVIFWQIFLIEKIIFYLKVENEILSYYCNLALRFTKLKIKKKKKKSPLGIVNYNSGFLEFSSLFSMGLIHKGV